MARRRDLQRPHFRRRAKRKDRPREKPDRDGLQWRREHRRRRGCTEKVRFVSKREVSRRAAELFEDRGLKLHYYRCPDCKGFHLTKRGTDIDE